MNRARIIVLVGNIGSGKSTLAKEYVADDYICISRDSFRYQIGSGDYIFNMTYEPIIHLTEKFMIEEFMKKRINLVIDETGINKEMRKPYIYLAQQYNYECRAVEVTRISKEQAVGRRMNCPHGDGSRKFWEDIWQKFEDRYEQPTVEEGFDNVIRL